MFGDGGRGWVVLVLTTVGLLDNNRYVDVILDFEQIGGDSINGALCWA